MAAGGGPAAGGGGPGREGEGVQVEESAGRCGVTMTTGLEAAREVTGTRLALGHVGSDAGVGLRLAPPPTRAGPRAAAGCSGPSPARPPSPPPSDPRRRQRGTDAGVDLVWQRGVQCHRESRKSRGRENKHRKDNRHSQRARDKWRDTETETA